MAVGLVLISKRSKPAAMLRVEEIRLGEAQIDLLRAERHHRADAQILSAAEEIALAQM